MGPPTKPARNPRGILRTLVADTAGLYGVCGPGTTIRWLSNIAATAPACLTSRSLQPADVRMGARPITARRGGARATLTGADAISGIREIWVRDVYLGGGFLTIRDGDTVLDLGANMGNFTLLALGHGPKVRVLAVEPSTRLCAKWRESVAVNGWQDRATLINGFIGGATASQAELQGTGECAGVPYVSERQFIERFGITRVDYMKVDIEGSEYELLRPEGLLLRLARQIAVEVHSNAGDVDAFEERLRGCGFEVAATVRHPVADILLARRPRGWSPA